MKKLIIRILATTGLSVILLAIVMRVVHPGFDLFFTAIVFQCLGANVVIHSGLLLTRLFESKYLALEIMLDVAYISVVLIIFGVIFNWFEVTPKWMLVGMAVLIHGIALFLNMVRLRKEASIINGLLRSRNNKQHHGRKTTQEMRDSDDVQEN